MRDSHEKGAGMRDQDPPFQTLWNILSSKKIRLCQLNQSFLYCLRSEIVLLRPEFYVVMLFLPDES